MAAKTAAQLERIILEKNCKNKDECAICIDTLASKTVAYLPCSHFFHHACLKQAFAKQLYTCPLCRYDLVPALTKMKFVFPVYTPPIYSFIFPYDDMPELIDDEEDDDLTAWTDMLVDMMGETANLYAAEPDVVIYTFAGPHAGSHAFTDALAGPHAGPHSGPHAGPHAEPDVFFTSTLYRPH